MVSAQRHLPSALPSPSALYPKPRRFSPQCLGRFGDRSPARHLLCWLLLGVDDVVVRWWRDERVMDHGHCHACVRGEGRRRAPCLACCWRRSHLRRCLAADAIVNVRYGSLADIAKAHPGCLLYPQKQTCSSSASMSAKCHKPTFQSDDCFCRPDANPRPFATSIARVIRVFEGRSGSRIFSAVSAPATGNVLS